MNKRPDEILNDLAEVFKKKNAEYKDNYKSNFGQVMSALFPDGVDLKYQSDFARFGIFCNIVFKLTRYTPRWKEWGHEDSMTDLAVYAAMLQELDTIERNATRFNLGKSRTITLPPVKYPDAVKLKPAEPTHPRTYKYYKTWDDYINGRETKTPGYAQTWGRAGDAMAKENPTW